MELEGPEAMPHLVKLTGIQATPPSVKDMYRGHASFIVISTDTPPPFYIDLKA